MNWKLSYTLILFFALRAICKKMTVRYLAINVTVNPEYMKQCSITIQPDRESLDVNLTVSRDLDQNLRSWMSFSGNIGSQKNSIPDVQFDFPLCDIINNGMKAKSQMITNSLRSFFKQGTLPAKCPIKAGNYTWRSLRPRKEHMPDFALGGVFRIFVQLYTKHDMQEVHSLKEFVDKTGKVTMHKAVFSFTLI